MRGAITFLLSWTSVLCSAQHAVDSTRIADLLATLAERHFAPRIIDDQFSADVYTTYLSALDPDTLFIADDERRSLEPHRLRIDDQLKQGVHTFLRACDSLMNVGLVRASAIIDHSGSGTFATAIHHRWEEKLRAQAAELDVALNANAPATSSAQEARTLIATRTQGELERRMERGKQERFDLFLATLAGVHDAQSTYLSAEEHSGFEQAMTSTFVGVGIDLVRHGMCLRVEALEPGGPAALSGRIVPGDELVQVSNVDGDLVPVLGMTVDQVVQLLRGPLGSPVTLHVRSAEGGTNAVPMQRATIRPDAGRAQARVLYGDGTPIGLITLPRFYADLSGGDGPRCADDVAVLLDSLLHEGIGGLVIDLRDDQGGSMSETIRLLGLFLVRAAVAQRLGRDGNVRVLSTSEAQARYRGPLVVLVNARSASASEFFSAALQDHRRAVIMGAPHTYGKGTIQTLADLPPVPGPEGATIAAGSAKITVGLFFRPSGGTVQLHGVTPDVVLPGPHDTTATGERALAFALDHPGIAPTTFTPFFSDGPVPPSVLARARARETIAVEDEPIMRSRSIHAPWTIAASAKRTSTEDAGIHHAFLLLQDLNGTAASK